MKIRFTLVLLFCSCLAMAQNNSYQYIDSLQKRLDSIPNILPDKKFEILLRLGQQYTNTGDYVMATTNITKALAIADALNNDSLLALGYKHFGVVHYAQHNYEKGELYYNKALEIANRKGNVAEQSILLKNMGDVYLQNNDSLKANTYYNKALVLYKKLGDVRGEASVYSNQSILCGSNYPQKIALAMQAKKIWEEFPPNNTLPIINLGNIGVAYLDIVRNNNGAAIAASTWIPSNKKQLLQLSEQYLKQAIHEATEKGFTDDAGYFTGVLAELQEQQGDFKNAYYNFRKYQNAMDSIFSQENKNQIAAMESQREIDLKNKTIENNELLLKNQRTQLGLLFAGITFFIVLGALLYRQNLTRKKTNTQLQLLNKELEAANQVKAKFFGILSHDLRSPVANLINFLQLQKRNRNLFSESQIAERENKISQSAENVLETMEGILLWSKGQMEHFKPEMESVRVADLFKYVDQFFTEKGSVNIRFEDEEQLLVLTDVNYLQTILRNLTGNAIKALQQTDNPTITWKAETCEGKTQLSITDNGPGIPPEKLANLFENTQLSGTHGLGLHIVKDLAKSIGCQIAVRSNGSGTCFMLTI